MLATAQDIEAFVFKQEDYSIVASDFPLIYNLNILENIALIKEVHEYMPTSKAQELALEYLKKIDLAHIAYYRVEKCTSIEIFYVMFIRAIMTKEKDIIVKNPHLMMESFHDFDGALETLQLLNSQKHILIVDIKDNEMYYEGSQCNIIK